MFRFSLIFLNLFFVQIFFGQYSSIRIKKVKPDLPFILDTLTILPNSLTVKLNEEVIDSNWYSINFESNKFELLNSINDSIIITYKVYPTNLRKSFMLRDTSIIFRLNSSYDKDNFLINSNNYTLDDVFGGQDLKKNGSVSRGLNFGNNQNLGLNSSLNLELSGDISPNLKLLASVSDANIPIQPQGTTSKLQEFDQLFIQIYNEKLKLIAGDFWLKSPMGSYMQYNKRAQGLSFSLQKQVKKGQWNTLESVALSKGKFNRQNIQGIESNQGPYRLLGAENEPYIIILAGTEKIFIDGKQLERGQEYDYIIDYNTSELTFTSRNLITKDSRIVAEFQYTDQSYARSLLQSSTSFKCSKMDFWLNAYTEQDAKNQNLQQELTLEQKNFLNTIGDSLNFARISSINEVGFIPNQILYAMIDTLGYDSVLRYSNNTDSAIYRVSFVYVGVNKGNYKLKDQIAFGKIYEWVEPLAGIPQGEYSPSRKLITPKKQQLITSGIKYKLSKNNSVELEGGISNNDINLFSRRDENDNIGFIGKFLFKNKIPISVDRKTIIWENSVLTEYISRNFKPIQQFRKVEFDRDWNVRGMNYIGQQLNAEFNSEIKHLNAGYAKFKGQHYSIGNSYQGNRIFSEGKLKNKIIHSIWDASVLNSKSSLTNNFIRHRLDINKPFKTFKIGFKDDHESNLFSQNHNIFNNSYQFYDYQIYIAQGDSSKNEFKLFYRERFDWKLDSSSNSLKKTAKGTTSGIEVTFNQFDLSKLVFIMGIRNLQILDSILMPTIGDNSAIGRIEYQWRTKKGDFNINSFYEIGSGLEQKKDFIYFKVNDGQGIYNWIDYNGDGIEQLNEFEIAQFTDQANYIRVFTPSSEYSKTFNNECNLGLFWKPERRWKRNEHWLGVLSRFSNQTRFRIVKKINENNLDDLLNPFNIAIASQNLISTNSTIKNSLFFNRTSSIFSAEYQITNTQSKILLATGYDGKSLISQNIQLNWNLTKHFGSSLKLKTQEKQSEVDYTQNRNFIQDIKEMQFDFSFQPNTNQRFGVFYRVGNKNNLIGDEVLDIHELGLNGKLNQTLKGSLIADIRFANLKFIGNPNTSVGYDMLEALQPGSNAVWSLSYQKLLSKNMQLSFSYNGRKSENSRFIHSGGMELRAFF